jgi:hypothetical protein
MKSLFFFVCVLLPGLSFLKAQVVLQEDFETGTLPANWTQSSNATDGGWQISDPGTLSSQYWPIASNGSGQIAATNDDACNCNKREDFLITPPLDFSGLTSIALGFDYLFGKGSYQSFTERATIEVSLNGVNWIELAELGGHGVKWESQKIDLSTYAGQDSVFIGFHYDDNGGWLYGLAVDNIQVEVPPSIDARLVSLNSRPFGEENTEIDIHGSIFNNGSSTINSIEVEYVINGGLPEIAIIESLNVIPFTSFEFHHPVSWIPQQSGDYEINVTINKVNGTEDENALNNTLLFETEIYPHVIAPNKIDAFLDAPPVFTTIATSANGLDRPTDLDFFPILAKNELWVVNQRVESEGASTLTIYNPATPDESFLERVDGNAWHFMSLATGIAFSDNFNFGTSPGVQDANHNGGTFTGPALWTSDPEIYAQPSGGNGSHLDMLHASPYSMGIASEGENVFWVFDGWNGNVVRYDFQEDHGPGNDDHADGIIRRYTEVAVKRDGNIPSHLVLDKEAGWLYVVDNGNDRVLRLDIHSGNVVNSLPLINEPLGEYSQMGNVVWEVIIDSLTRPSGIDLIENRLLVGDFTTGEISIYDVDNGFSKMGTIPTGQAGLTGIKVGPDGAIWCTNRTQNTLVKIEPGEISAVEENPLLALISISPNPSSGIVNITMPEESLSDEVQFSLKTLEGKSIMFTRSSDQHKQLDLMHLPAGLYLLNISDGSSSVTRKIILTH